MYVRRRRLTVPKVGIIRYSCPDSQRRLLPFTGRTMDSTQKIDGQCTALAEHLAARRTAILQAWRTAVGGDPQLATASSLPRAQFYDHIPGLLDAFERKLHAWPVRETTSAEEKQKEDSSSHGLVRGSRASTYAKSPVSGATCICVCWMNWSAIPRSILI